MQMMQMRQQQMYNQRMVNQFQQPFIPVGYNMNVDETGVALDLGDQDIGDTFVV